MPRRHRIDAPGLLHHVMNRGLARRTIFETRRDVVHFLLLLACEARAGRIELLAYSILTTHFHLLIRSRTGEIDRVMQRVLNLYVRYFNRTRRRDGPLFRGRYVSKPVRSIRYRRVLVRYIDQNAPAARLTAPGEVYPYGSQALYVARRRPLWLGTAWIDEVMGNPSPEDRPEAYARCFGSPLCDVDVQVVDRRLHAHAEDDDWDSLLEATVPEVLAWMRRKTLLADGTHPGLPYTDAATVALELEHAKQEIGAWTCAVPGGPAREAWPVLHAAFLRELAGMTWLEVGRGMNVDPRLASRRVEQHALLLESDPLYAQRAAELAAACLHRHDAVV